MTLTRINCCVVLCCVTASSTGFKHVVCGLQHKWKATVHFVRSHHPGGIPSAVRHRQAGVFVKDGCSSCDGLYMLVVGVTFKN